MITFYTPLWIFLNELEADLSLANTSHSIKEEESSGERLALTRAEVVFEPPQVGLLPRENWAR
jgi:hypothetical protein